MLKRLEDIVALLPFRLALLQVAHLLYTYIDECRLITNLFVYKVKALIDYIVRSFFSLSYDKETTSLSIIYGIII